MKKNKFFILAVLVWLISFQGNAQSTHPYQICNTSGSLTFDVNWSVVGTNPVVHGSLIIPPNTCVTIPGFAAIQAGCTASACQTEIQITKINGFACTGGLPTCSSAGCGGCTGTGCFAPSPFVVTTMNWTFNLCTIN